MWADFLKGGVILAFWIGGGGGEEGKTHLQNQEGQGVAIATYFKALWKRALDASDR